MESIVFNHQLVVLHSFYLCHREPGIYKQDYLLELFKRYDDPSDVLSAPERPAWCMGETPSFL